MSQYADRFTALLDVCVLGGALCRNMLLSLAEAGLFRPRWSDAILDETGKAVERITKGEADGSRQRAKIEGAFPEALVTGYEIFKDALALPDPKDNHVLAAAIATCASVIVTDNVADFPSKALAPHAIQAMSADDFIADTIELYPEEAILALRKMRQRLRNPPLDVAALIDKCKAQNLPRVASLITA